MKLRTSLNRMVASIWNYFDLQDVFFLAGMAALGYGLWLWDEKAAFITIGAILVVLTSYGRIVK